MWWLANQLTRELPDEAIGIYAGADRSGVMRGGRFERTPRDALKDAVCRGSTRSTGATAAKSATSTGSPAPASWTPPPENEPCPEDGRTGSQPGLLGPHHATGDQPTGAPARRRPASVAAGGASEGETDP